MVSGRPPDYLFGQSAGEAERLRLQARMFAPYTARFLQDAGISPGMKVLDVGTGAGDVALLAAGLAGREGAVVGIDFNAELIAAARARAAAAGMGNVSFAVGDAASAELDRDFDAVVGRCVLFFAREPAVLVRRLTGYVRDGGIVAFQEPANATLAPRWGGLDSPGYEYMARLIRTLLPRDAPGEPGVATIGVATEQDVGIDTLAERLRAEIGDDGVAVTWGFITAWARHQARP